MPRMPRDLSGDRVITILQHNGFAPVKRKPGSHISLKKKKDGKAKKKITVPDHKTVTIGTLHQILRNSGKDRDEFIELSQVL